MRNMNDNRIAISFAYAFLLTVTLAMLYYIIKDGFNRLTPLQQYYSDMYGAVNE